MKQQIDFPFQRIKLYKISFLFFINTFHNQYFAKYKQEKCQNLTLTKWQPNIFFIFIENQDGEKKWLPGISTLW